MRIDLDVFGDKQLSRQILRVGDRVEDASPALRGLADYFRRAEVRQFNTEGQTGSGGWPPLAPSTILRRGGGHGFDISSGGARSTFGAGIKILDDTGALRESLTQAGDEQHVERVTNDELVFGTIVPYAKYHQRGTSKMPRRRPVELSETQRKEAVRRLQKYLMTGEV